MRKHKQFEELCSLAVIGELSPGESSELMAHLRTCEGCQSSFLEFSEIASERLSLAVRHRGDISNASLKNVRDGVLERVAAEGLRITPDALSGPVSLRRRLMKNFEDLRWVFVARKAQVAVSFVTAVLIVFFIVVLRHDRTNERQIKSLQAEVTRNNGDTDWILNDYEGALTKAKQENKPIFIEFTGYSCPICRWMEANIFPRPEVEKAMDKFVRVRLYTDREGEPFERQQKMLHDKFGVVTFPLYAVVRTNGSTVASLPGHNPDANQFLAFLRKASESLADSST